MKRADFLFTRFWLLYQVGQTDTDRHIYHITWRVGQQCSARHPQEVTALCARGDGCDRVSKPRGGVMQMTQCQLMTHTLSLRSLLAPSPSLSPRLKNVVCYSVICVAFCPKTLAWQLQMPLFLTPQWLIWRSAFSYIITAGITSVFCICSAGIKGKWHRNTHLTRFR